MRNGEAYGSTFSPDTAIQAVVNRSKWTDAERASALGQALFKNLRTGSSREEWEAISAVLSVEKPGKLHKRYWKAFLEFFDYRYPNLSAQAVARVVASTRSTDKQVSRILSFNAESLLAALITARILEPQIDFSWPDAVEGELTQHVDLITHSYSYRRAGRIPYYFCHGTVCVPDKKMGFGSEDKLVWSEHEYLSLSNSNFSWQSSVVLDAFSSTSVVFIGVSLTDSNMRRWLSWAHELRLNELSRSRGIDGADSAPHYWLCERPSDKAEETWIEAAVGHLGVRVVWLEHWGEIELALRRMLDLP